jgi:hypothetical protein
VNTPLNIAIVCGIAGVTALAIVAVPALWHQPPQEASGRSDRWVWPAKALLEPQSPPPILSGNVAIADAAVLPSLTTPKKVTTEKYLAQTAVPKTAPAPLSLPEALKPKQQKPEEEPERRPHDVCAKYGGHRVTFVRHHHEGWRCVYPRKERR